MEEIVNKVANSKIVTLDMEELLPTREELVIFDLADYLFQGLVLREKDFRMALKELDWSVYQEKDVIITCTADAIVPIWAYMLVSTYLDGVASEIAQTEEPLFLAILEKKVQEQHELLDLTDRPIVIKGCASIPFKESLYLKITQLVKPFAKTIMYGEPCSTVPIYKKKKINNV